MVLGRGFRLLVWLLLALSEYSEQNMRCIWRILEGVQDILGPLILLASLEQLKIATTITRQNQES